MTKTLTITLGFQAPNIFKNSKRYTENNVLGI